MFCLRDGKSYFEEREQFINDFVKEYAADKYENMLIIDMEGFAHYVTSNLPAGINCEIYSDVIKDSYNIHTHPPDETQFSFSTDIDFPAMFSDGTRIMEACDYKYRYRFERPENLTFDEWDAARAETENLLPQILFSRGYSMDEDLSEELKDILIKETCKKLNIDCYRRWLL